MHQCKHLRLSRNDFFFLPLGSFSGSTGFPLLFLLFYSCSGGEDGFVYKALLFLLSRLHAFAIQRRQAKPHFTFKHHKNKLPTLISDPRSTIGITYLPSALPCCYTVSKLNLRDRSPVLQQKTSGYEPGCLRTLLNHPTLFFTLYPL